MPGDPRVQILNEMGFVNAPGVEALEKTNTKKEFALTISKEKVADVDADVVVAYVDGHRGAEVPGRPGLLRRSARSSAAAPT